MMQRETFTRKPLLKFDPQLKPLYARGIPPALLSPDDPGKGFAGRIEFGEWVELQASRLADTAILAGKREAAEQVRPDFEPVKPRLPFGWREFHQFGGFRLRCLHGSMLPALIGRQGRRG